MLHFQRRRRGMETGSGKLVGQRGIRLNIFCFVSLFRCYFRCRLRFPCTGRFSSEVDVHLHLNVTMNAGRKSSSVTQLRFKRKKICLQGKPTWTDNISVEIHNKSPVRLCDVIHHLCIQTRSRTWTARLPFVNWPCFEFVIGNGLVIVIGWRFSVPLRQSSIISKCGARPVWIQRQSLGWRTIDVACNA